jgi:hypothetical protein
LAKKPSTALSQDADVGVKWKVSGDAGPTIGAPSDVCGFLLIGRRLQAAINRFVIEHNVEPKPFTWTADPDKIIQAVRRGHQVLVSVR